MSPASRNISAVEARLALIANCKSREPGPCALCTRAAREALAMLGSAVGPVRVGDVLESKDGKRRTVVRVDTDGCLYVRTPIGGNGMIYPSNLSRYRVVRP